MRHLKSEICDLKFARLAREAVDLRPFVAIMHAATPLEATRRFLDSAKMVDELAHQRVLNLAADLRKEIILRLASAKDYEAFRLPHLLGDINRTMDEWRRQYLAESNELFPRYSALGVAQVDGPLTAANILTPQMPASSIKVFEIAQRFNANLVTHVTSDTIAAITREVTLATTGVQPPFEAMKKIQAQIDDPLHFGSLQNRAEVILRTEGGRVQSLAAQARLEDAVAVVPGLQKQWLWSGNSRVQHQRINGQIKNVGEPFEIPAQGKCPADKIMFPRDPAGLACQTINCGCQSIPYKAEWELDKLAA